MTFKLISRARQKRRCSGLSVLEMLVASSLASLVFAATAMLWIFSAKSFTALGNYGDLDKASRNALDLMSRDIRQTKGLTSYSPTSLTFQDWDSGSLTYTYNASARTLTRQKSGVNTLLLGQCDYLNFDISQRNPSNNFTFYPATNASVAKLIDVSWRCSRTIFGAKINTESVQTAKIVIRN